jgi:hypothetical protein
MANEQSAVSRVADREGDFRAAGTTVRLRSRRVRQAGQADWQLPDWHQRLLLLACYT